MIYKLRVHPNSEKEEIEEKEGILHIFVKEKAEDNKANIAVIKSLAKHFKKNYKDIKLKGLKSKNKVVEVKE